MGKSTELRSLETHKLTSGDSLRFVEFLSLQGLPLFSSLLTVAAAFIFDIDGTDTVGFYVSWGIFYYTTFV